MAQGSGYGKVILFNEHFVVYGIPSIASAIDSRTIATVEHVPKGELPAPSGREGSMAGDGWVMEDDRPANPGYKETKKEQQKRSIELVFEAARFDPRKRNVRIHLGGDLIAVGGVGASAAVCVSVARALNTEFKLGFDDKRINEIAFIGDSAYAGTPSGIDNTASTFGGLLWFAKNHQKGPNTMEQLKIKAPLRIVMGNTLLTTNTEAAVAGVRERKAKFPEKYDAIFAKSRELADRARDALSKYDIAEVGRLMDENHSLLQQIEVSHPKLDELVGIARRNGAAGAKMTGGGLGGYMVALTPEMAVQDKVATAMEKAGFKALKTTIGV
ncbi:MAG: mevalonate kinase [Euryarchaeota archaeon]|nr:mevalonate kinase [Euryarchaeota archaeon]